MTLNLCTENSTISSRGPLNLSIRETIKAGSLVTVDVIDANIKNMHKEASTYMVWQFTDVIYPVCNEYYPM